MSNGSGLSWFGFWIFLAVFMACDHWVFSQGYDSLFQTHKTEAELEIQQIKIEKLREKYNVKDSQE